MIVTLQRLTETKSSTIGTLEIPFLGTTIYTLEDSWMDNQVGNGRIPPGTYNCVPHGWEDNTPFKFKKVWMLQKTAPREAILIHSGNDAGDTHGCILVGLTKEKDFIGDSRKALDILRSHIGNTSFTLEIRDAH